MRGRPHRIRAVEEYWWHTEVLPLGGSCEHTRAFADAAVTALEGVVQRMQDATNGTGLVEEGLPAIELEALVCGKQKRIEELESLLAAAYETYADDGFLVTKEEWLEALMLLTKEQKNS
jgi:hypothetical protein